MPQRHPETAGALQTHNEVYLGSARTKSIETITCRGSTTKSACRNHRIEKGRGGHGIDEKEIKANFRLPSIHSLISYRPYFSAGRALPACSYGQLSDPKVSERLHHGSHSEQLQPTHRRGFFLLPCNEREQDRLDFLHKVFSIARRSDDPIHLPHSEKGRILDLGCGTGIWAIDVAQTYPEMFVVGVDLSRIQPDRHPPNCEFYAPFDFERRWQMGEDSWDVVHLRMGWGSVSNWFNLYRRVIAHLLPGGWFEQVEIDIEPRFLNNPSRHSPLRKWYQAFERAIALPHSSQDTMSFLRTAGFTEISHQTIRLPLNQWSSDSHQRKIGRWYGLAFLQFIESLDIGLFSGTFSSAPNEARELINQAKAEASDRSVHSFHVLHIYRAQKPR